MNNDHDLAQQVDRLTLESKADWPSFVPATEHPTEWEEWFSILAPGADLSEWRVDLKRCIAHGPGGQTLFA